MLKLLKPAMVQKLVHFLGPRATTYLVVSIFVGLFFFVIEILFAFTLQVFFLAVGIVSESATTIPLLFKFSNFNLTIFMVFSVGALRGLVQWANFYFTQAISEAFRCEQRARILNWAFHSPSVSSGRVTALFHEHTGSVALSISALQGVAVFLPTSLLLWITLFKLAKIPTLIATSLLVALGFFLRLIDRKISKAGTIASQETNVINARLLLNIKNLLLMQIYGTEKEEENLIRVRLMNYRKQMLNYIRLSGFKYAMPQIVGVGLICMITVLASKTHALTPATLISYFYLFVRFVQTLAETARSMSILSFNRASFSHIRSWWANEGSKVKLDSDYDVGGPEQITLPFKTPVGWRLQNVTFFYPGSTRPVIKYFDLFVRPGETLVITGASGSGKSTLLSLLLGGVSSNEGSIRLVCPDGSELDLKQYRKKLLRTTGYVGPDSFLIEGSVLDNLVYGLDRAVNEEAIREVLQKTECQFVFDLPNGLSHFLTEQGHGLSAGQKQRLSLARAILRNPKVLLLDEATANLDEETESRLVDTLATLKGSMTIVAITHRSAMLRIKDQRVQLNPHA